MALHNFERVCALSLLGRRGLALSLRNPDLLTPQPVGWKGKALERKEEQHGIKQWFGDGGARGQAGGGCKGMEGMPSLKHIR